MKINKKYTLRILMIYLIIILLASIPVISAGLASFISEYYGCTLNEGSEHPCQVLGHESGAILYSMFVFGWLAIATIPLGLILLLVLTIFSIINYKKFINKN